MRYKKLVTLMAALFATATFATTVTPTPPKNPGVRLYQQPGFFRFSFDNIKMPNQIENMGLLGINYFADLTPSIYGGVGAYGAVTGNQGGLFTLGLAGGFHHQIIGHLSGDAGLFVGGGGGRSSLVGGGLMIRPNVGLVYDFEWTRLGLHYSYVDFPDGDIHSGQVGLDLDFPFDFNYVQFQNVGSTLFSVKDIHLPIDKFLGLQRNDFALLVQAYIQRAGTLNTNGEVQDGTIGLVGAELDHYMTDRIFWSLKAAGAFSGIPNGYMDVLGGLGYRLPLGTYGFALVPQFLAGAGGGGNTDTGGGILLQPQLGIEWPLTSHFAARLNGGYLWSPKGQMHAATATGMVIYHLDVAAAGKKTTINMTDLYRAYGWRIQLFNQTYIHPQRTHNSMTSPANLVAVQIDQLFTPYFFLSYQGASAYGGNHTGGLATGMIGPGLQTPMFANNHVHLFAEMLIGAGGGGGLALGGGAIIEPVLGIHYAFTPAIGVQTSVSQIKALRHNLNTPVINAGLTISFGMLDKV